MSSFHEQYEQMLNLLGGTGAQPAASESDRAAQMDYERRMMQAEQDQRRQLELLAADQRYTYAGIQRSQQSPWSARIQFTGAEIAASRDRQEGAFSRAIADEWQNIVRGLNKQEYDRYRHGSWNQWDPDMEMDVGL